MGVNKYYDFCRCMYACSCMYESLFVFMSECMYVCMYEYVVRVSGPIYIYACFLYVCY